MTGCEDSNGTTSASGANGEVGHRDTGPEALRRHRHLDEREDRRGDAGLHRDRATARRPHPPSGDPTPPARTPQVLTPPAAVVKGTLTARFRRVANRLRVRAFLLRGAARGTRLVVRCIGSRCRGASSAPPSAPPGRPHSPRRCAPCACVAASACAQSCAAPARQRAASLGRSASAEPRNRSPPASPPDRQPSRAVPPEPGGRQLNRGRPRAACTATLNLTTIPAISTRARSASTRHHRAERHAGHAPRPSFDHRHPDAADQGTRPRRGPAAGGSSVSLAATNSSPLGGYRQSLAR